MEDFGLLLEVTMDIMKTPVTIWGFTFSWWEVFVFTIVAAIVFLIVAYVLLGR